MEESANKAERIRPIRTLLLPYGQTMGGKSFPIVLDITFEAELLWTPLDEDGETYSYMELKVLELTGTCQAGKVYNMKHLVDNEDEITQCLMECILGNENQWDETYHWWCESKPEPNDEPLLA